MTACAAAWWAEKNTGKQTFHGGYFSTQGQAAGIQTHRHTDTSTVQVKRKLGTIMIHMILHELYYSEGGGDYR